MKCNQEGQNPLFSGFFCPVFNLLPVIIRHKLAIDFYLVVTHNSRQNELSNVKSNSSAFIGKHFHHAFTRHREL